MQHVTFWRLVKSRYAETAFDGYGARTFGGRWNSIGQSCVYLCSSKALCVLEILVHLEVQDLRDYTFLSIDVPSSLIATLDHTALPNDWCVDPPPLSTRIIGDEWLNDSQNGLLLQVPSALTGENNALFNPRHLQAEKVLKSIKTMPFSLDHRLAKCMKT